MSNPEIYYSDDSSGTWKYTETESSNLVIYPTSTSWEQSVGISIKTSDETGTIEYTIDNPDDADSWAAYTGTFEITENCTIYARISYGNETYGEIVSLTVTNIDNTSPTVSIVLGSYTDASISLKVNCDDDDGSGPEIYTFSLSSDGSTWETADTVNSSSSIYIYKYINLNAGSEYYVRVSVEDEAGNVGTSSAINVTTASSSVSIQSLDSDEVSYYYGDSVDYSIDLDGDGDTTDDWLLYYVDGDDIYLISAKNITHEDGESEWIDWDNTGLTYNSNYTSPVYWSSAPTKTWTTLMSSTMVGVNKDKTGTNGLFMFEYSLGSSSTYSNMKCISVLLNTEYWDQLVDATYADYAIGSSTVEMWIEAWEAKGYTKLYLAEGSYGYYIGITSDPLTTYQYVTSSYISASGYDDTLFFPGTGSSDYNYWLASPGAIGSDGLVYVYCNGSVNYNTYSDTNIRSPSSGSS